LIFSPIYRGGVFGNPDFAILAKNRSDEILMIFGSKFHENGRFLIKTYTKIVVRFYMLILVKMVILGQNRDFGQNVDFWSIFGSKWSILVKNGPKMVKIKDRVNRGNGENGPNLVDFWVKMVDFGSKNGQKWSIFGPKWSKWPFLVDFGHFGSFWVNFGPKMTTLAVPKNDHLGVDFENLDAVHKITCHFFEFRHLLRLTHH
jgi:hypothetical protein